MPFKLCVTRTVNGASRTLRWTRPDEKRTELERVIGDFNAGRWPMEGTLTLSCGGSSIEDPEWSRSWRWADVRAMWIEEA